MMKNHPMSSSIEQNTKDALKKRNKSRDSSYEDRTSHILGKAIVNRLTISVVYCEFLNNVLLKN